MHYQMQEMIRLERMYEPELIQQELDVYNPLIPDGANWKATLMIEYPDAEERKEALEKLHRLRAGGVDAGRRNAPRSAPSPMRISTGPRGKKTSAVHFLRFELTPEMVAAVKAGAPILAGVDHPHYAARVALSQETRDSLARDLR